jgi:hypothetical protein
LDSPLAPQYVATFSNLAEAAEADLARVRECALNAIRDPYRNRDVAAFPAVQRLKESDAKLFELVQIVCGEGSLIDFLQFAKVS